MTFSQIDPLVRKREGGYVNVAGDSGGETYGGIARNYNPKWIGWPVLDKLKAQNGGSLKRYWTNPQLDALVPAFYKEKFWDPNEMDKFPAGLRYLIYDSLVNMGFDPPSRASKVWSILRQAARQPASLRWDVSLFEIAKKVTPDAFAEERKRYYNSIVAANPSQKTFINEWLSRTEDVLNVTKNWITQNPGISIVTGLFFLGAAYLGYKFLSKGKK